MALSYGSWVYNYICNQCLSPLMLRVRISIRARCTTLCGKVYQWFSPGILVSSIYKNDHHDIIEILLKVALNTIKQTTNIILYCQIWFQYHSSRCHDSIFYVHFGLTVNIWRINYTQDSLVTNQHFVDYGRPLGNMCIIYSFHKIDQKFVAFFIF